MKKTVIIINGKGGVGKDTLVSYVSLFYKTLNVSCVEPIKEIALQYGWNGEKDNKGRKFLSNLKQAFVEYNDLPLNYTLDKYTDFVKSDQYDLMFVHIREPQEIERFKLRLDPNLTNIITLLVVGRNDDVDYGNSSDNDVCNYEYDYVFNNGQYNLENSLIEFKKVIDNICHSDIETLLKELKHDIEEISLKASYDFRELSKNEIEEKFIRDINNINGVSIESISYDEINKIINATLDLDIETVDVITNLCSSIPETIVTKSKES